MGLMENILEMENMKKKGGLPEHVKQMLLILSIAHLS